MIPAHRLKSTLLGCVVLCSACSGPTTQTVATPPTEAADEPTADRVSPWGESFNQGAHWKTVSTSDGQAWRVAVEAAQDELFRCFADYAAFVDECRRGEFGHTKISVAFAPRQDFHGPPLADGHALVSAMNRPYSGTDACMDDYESSSSFVGCVERAVGDQFSGAFDTADPLTIIFANTEPTMGGIGF